MAASIVRSRRAEVSSPFQNHLHSPRHHRSQPQRRMPIATAASSRQNILHNTVQNAKRAREVSDSDLDPITSKKARISIELLAKSARKTEKAPPTNAAARAEVPAVNKPTSLAATGNKTTAKPNRAVEAEQPASTKHQEKVIKGLKHELKELQPSAPEIKEQGRKLRSQEATRFKSELSAYFPDYDEVIGNDPKEEHILNIETPIVVVAGQPLPDSKGHIPPHGSTARGQNYAPHSYDKWPVRGYRDALFTDLFDAQVINFGFLETQYKGRTPNDPLPDSYFEPAHKKAERLERSIRNSEKGRAQHEKDQIIRLLEGLQGHDWLRTMGVSGITESRKKTFEPARAHFIKGCKAILEKFRLWSQEEKRRKLEKERALAEEARAREKESSKDSEEEESEEEHEAESEDDDSETNPSSAGRETDQSSRTSSDRTSDGDSRENSDVDAHIEKQLRNDILMASSKSDGKNSKQRKAPPARLPTPEPPPPPREFTSFFEKKYQRDAALSKSRRKGRTVLAWGHPVPEPPEADFDLPEEFRDVETLRSQARRKRRDRRGVGKP